MRHASKPSSGERLSQSEATARAKVESTFSERAFHDTEERVRTTCSFARAERLLGREYHGRFLIELLQNAADAWRSKATLGARSRLAILLAPGPSLVVANQGVTFPADVVISSLGHIGASTKARGEAIGHKGIGFKSVLELSLTPELYSGLQSPSPELAVRFDPVEALARIRSASPAWDRFVEGISDLEGHDVDAVPVLRFPTWVDELPDIVKELRSRAFDTVVILPFDQRFADRLHLDETSWLTTVRGGLADITDHILLLLGTFDEVQIEDRLAGMSEVITPHWHAAIPLEDGIHRESVEVRRNGVPTSHWRLYRRSVPNEGESLLAEIAVGMRFATNQGVSTLIPPVGNQPSAPFHLFFPTKIGSGVPLLLHGYFEVNAARTGFYEGSGPHNEGILKHLADLVAEAVGDTARERAIDLSSMVELLAAAAEPEDHRARQFNSNVLDQLDHVDWVPLARRDGSHASGAPVKLLSCEQPQVLRHVERCFPDDYVTRMKDLGIPHARISPQGLEFLAKRRPADGPDIWSVLGVLLRPGTMSPWPEGTEGDGFRALLDLVAALEAHDRFATNTLLDELRGDPKSRLLPVIAPGGGRGLVPLPDPALGAAGRRSQLVMARVRPPGNSPIVPPSQLDVAFLPDGLLKDEREVDRAKSLGVRPFTVDNVLDRLNVVPGTPAAAAEMLRFLWQLLARERRSDFGTKSALQRAATFDPASWFWCQPGRSEIGDAERDRQRRERLLSEVLLPARDGTWRPANTLAFGHEWAEWLERHALGRITPSLRTRIAAYQDLDAVGPSDGVMLAKPETVLAFMAEPPLSEPDEPGIAEGEDSESGRLDDERHAFLLRLGVWEVIPIEGFEDRTLRDRLRFPWEGRLQELRLLEVNRAGGWAFDAHRWSGLEHQNVYVSEDYRFQWPLDLAARRNAISVARLLELGISLYSRLLSLSVFCPGCSSAGSRHAVFYRSTSDDGYPSTLKTELRHERWVPSVRHGEVLDDPQEPESVWWSAKVPTGAGLLQSPLRFLPLCSPEAALSAELRAVAGIVDIDSAGLDAVGRLLRSLRNTFESATPPAQPLDSSTARQAFVGVHRMAYERLADVVENEPEGVDALLDGVGVLCEVGECIAYRPRREAYHDDGKFASYRRYFPGSLPFVVLPRDKGPVAERLGLEPFRVSLTRRFSEEVGKDVTEELADVLTDRIPELLSIVVHHSLGTQTLEPTSQQFEERTRRLRSLRVRQVKNLIIDAIVEGTETVATLGEGSNQDIFLEGPTSAQPILFHDFEGDAWQERIRHRMAPYLASILENPAYGATFALFLLCDGDAEREAALQDLGITADDVESIRSRIGAVSDDDRRRSQRWFSAVCGLVRGGADLPLVDLESLTDELAAAGFSDADARRLVNLGGGSNVRTNTSADGALWLLEARGIDLQELDRRLRLSGDDGLKIRVAWTSLRQWEAVNARRVAAVLAVGQGPDSAKAEILKWEPPAELAFSLNPPLVVALAPVIASLEAAGYAPDPERLASDPTGELVRLANVVSVSELDARVSQLFDAEERRRILRSSAAAWRRELLILGVLSRSGPSDSRSAIRACAATVDELLPSNPECPTALRAALDELFPRYQSFARALSAAMEDSFACAGPERQALLTLAVTNGLEVDHLNSVVCALDAPRRDAARRTRERIAKLRECGLRLVSPAGLQPVGPKPPRVKADKKRVGASKAGEEVDRRKRHLGDEGERWALAAVLMPFLAMAPVERRTAIEDIMKLLDEFHGPPVDAVRAHMEPACVPDLDDEELIDELTALLHVSSYSDDFGFDLFGWMPPSPGEKPIAMGLEVKSSGDGSVHLSSGEWALATRWNKEGIGEQYALAVVRRAAPNGQPASLDLLVDPVRLETSGLLHKTDDGYKLAYAIRKGPVVPGHKGRSL